MQKTINAYQKSLSRKYIIYKLLTASWFISAVWLYFYRLFITDQQVGIMDASAFAIGLIAEVPSGVMADKFGRDKMVKIGQILAGCGLIIQGFGSSFMPFFVGQAILMIGVSFVSGAEEALFFDKLKFDKKSLHWRKLAIRLSQASIVGGVFAIIVGGWVHTINPRIPWILTGVMFMSSVLLIWSIKDDRIRKNTQKFSTEVKEWLGSIKKGFAQFRKPKLLLYVPIIVCVQGLFYATGSGMLRIILLDRFHFNPSLGSIAMAISSLITVIILALMYKYADHISEKRALTLIIFGAAASLIVSTFDIGIWGFVVILTLYAGEQVMYPFMSEILNKHTEVNQRATVLSVASFLRTLPYVILAPIIGYLSTHNNLEYFLVVWAIIMCVVVLIYLFFNKKDTELSIVQDK